jgi:hypothetical protein
VPGCEEHRHKVIDFVSLYRRQAPAALPMRPIFGGTCLGEIHLGTHLPHPCKVALAN